MLQVFITQQTATRIQDSSGTAAIRWFFETVNPSVNGQRYITSVFCKNNGTKNAVISDNLGSSKVIAPGQTIFVQLSSVGNGSTPLQFQIGVSPSSPTDPLDITAWNPKQYAQQNPTVNLIPSNQLNFSTPRGQAGWTAGTNAVVTLTQNQILQLDYTRYVSSGSLVISDNLNSTAEASFTLENLDDVFVVPLRESYIQIYSNQYNRYVFTGFISAEIQRDFTGLNSKVPSMNFQSYRFSIKVTSDEYLLGSKAVPMLPPFVNMGAGQILGLLANSLAPGYFDVSSKCLSGDLIPYKEYDPKQSWIDIAKEFADQFRYRFRILNKVLYYQPYGDLQFPITYDDTQNQKTFDPFGLKTTIFNTSLANDVYVLGDVEAGDNHEDYFLGDGFTSNFPLRYSAFQADTALLLQQDWSSGNIDGTLWFEQDPTNAITPGTALNINGGTGNLGETFLYLRSGIDLGRKTILEHGELFFVGNIGGNVIPDPDNFNNTWTDFSTGLLVYSSTGGLAGFGAKWTYTGTGSPSSFKFVTSKVFNVVPGTTYTLSAYINAGNTTAGAPAVVVSDPTTVTTYLFLGQTAGVNSRVKGSFTVPAGVSQVIVYFDTENCTVTTGQPLIFSNPQLEFGSNASTYNSPGLIIGGVYDNANTFAEVSGSGQCECGFDIRPAQGFVIASSVSGVSGIQIQPRRLGNLFGTPVITQQNHYYVLKTLISGRSQNRYTSTFKSFTGAIVSGGTNTALADITWIIDDINLNNTNPLQPGFVNTQPPTTTTRFTLRDQVVPAFALYVLANVANASLTIQWTNIYDPPQGSLSAAALTGVSGALLPPLSGSIGLPLDYELGFGIGRQFATIGNSSSAGGAAGSDGTGSVLQFYSDSIPGVGARIRYQGWEAKTSVARVQDPTSIATEASIVGDDGHRMAILSDFKPLPRSSEECEIAGKAALLDRINPIYQGSYTVRDIFFDFSQNLLLFSQQFDNAAWIFPTADASVTPNTDIAPDGTLTADTITDASAVNVQAKRQIIPIPLDTSSYTFSIYVKKTLNATASYSSQLVIGSRIAQIVVNTNTGAFVLGDSLGLAQSSIQNAGNYWRIVHTTANDGFRTSATVFIIPANGPLTPLGNTSVASTGSIVVWGAVFERNSSAATKYVQTTSTVIDHDYPRTGEFFLINSPQRNINNLQVVVSSVQINYLELWSEQANINIGFGPTKFLEKTLALFVPKPPNTLMPKDTAAQPTPIQLANVGSSFTTDLEKAKLFSATNLLQFSEQFNNSRWSKSQATVTPDSVIDPNGNLTADSVLFNPADGNSFLVQTILPTPSIMVGQPFTFSVWMKAASGTPSINLLIEDIFAVRIIVNTVFQLTTSWNRYSVTGIPSAGATGISCFIANPTSNSIAYHLWGAQLENSPVMSAAYAQTVDIAPKTNPPGQGFDSTTAYFDIGVTPANAVEVRRTNVGWGQNNNDRLGLFTTRTFSMPRTAFDQTWYLRQINGSFISRRSKAIRVAASLIPAPPGILTADSSLIQGNFNGDIRNIYGIELRGPDNATVLAQNPIGSIQDMTFDLQKLKATKFWTGSPNLLLYTEEFDNVVWQKLGGTTVINNAITDPNGLGSNADLLSIPGRAAGIVAGVQQVLSNIGQLPGQDPTSMAGKSFTFSVWLKVSGGTSQVQLVLQDYLPTVNLALPVVTVTSTWQRFNITGIYPANANVGLAVQIIAPFSSTTGALGIYAWGAQLEVANSVGTYFVNVDAYGPRNLLEATEEFDNTDIWLNTTSPSATGGAIQQTLPFNIGGISVQGDVFNTGKSGVGNGLSGFAYPTAQLGTTLNFAGVSFVLGTAGTNRLNTVSDNFSSIPNPPWVVTEGTFSVASNQLTIATTGGDFRASMTRNDKFYDADQFAQATVAVAPTGGNQIGVSVRSSQTAATYYAFLANSTNRILVKNVAGTVTNLTSAAGTFATNDVIEIRVAANNIGAYINGVAIFNVQDSAITSGSPGVAGVGNAGGSPALSNYSAGNISAMNNVIGCLGQIAPVISGYYNSLRILGSSVYGPQLNQIITVIYADGTSTSFTQSFSDWTNTGALQSNESLVKSTTNRNLQTGLQDAISAKVYHYQFALDPTKKLEFIQFPVNQNTLILAVSAVAVNYQTFATSTHGTDPLGNLSADQLIFAPNPGSGSQFLQTINPQAIKNKTFTFSVWLKTSGANVSLGIAVQDKPFTQNIFATGITVTNQWQRFTATGFFNSTPNGDLNVIIFNPNNVAAMTFAWGAQLEYGVGPTTYLGVGNVLRPFYLYFFNAMWGYSQPTIAFIATPPAPVIRLGNKLANLIEIQLDNLARTDIRDTTVQLSQDGSFLSFSSISVTGSGQPATFNLNVNNASLSGFYARAKRRDHLGEGPWSSILPIPYGNTIASNWIVGQGSIPPSLDNQTTALFTYTSSALAGGGPATGRIVISWPQFAITFASGVIEVVAANSYDTGTTLSSTVGIVTNYIFYPRLPSNTPSAQPQFINGAHDAQNPNDAALCYADGFLPLGGATIGLTFTVPAANAPGGGNTSGGGSGGGAKCIPIDELITILEGKIPSEKVALEHFILGANPETKEHRWNKVNKYKVAEAECVLITLKNGSKGKCSKGTDVPIWFGEKVVSYMKPYNINSKMKMLDIFGNLEFVESVEDIGMQKVMMIEAVPSHTIFAGDLLTHNGIVPKQ